MSGLQVQGVGDVQRHLEAYAEGLKSNALLAASEIAAVLKSYAIANHPWQVRTGDTNRTTQGTVIDAGSIIDIYVSAGMDYDVFLELSRNGKWAWLWPAIQANVDRIKRILESRLGSTRVGGQ